jgi:hypothetical protein
MLRELPRQTKSKRDVELEKIPKPKTLRVEPIRAKERKESELPQEIRSNTDTLEPKRVIP